MEMAKSEEEKTIMNYWWVNQNQTYKHEFGGGYMWSPKTSKNGGRIEYYVNMTRVNPGDAVFSFKDKLIVSVGIIQSTGYSSPKPYEFGKEGDVWSDDGWCVDVEYHELTHKIMPKSHIDEIRPLLPEKYSPIQANGDGNQVYLCAVPNEMATCLVDLIGEEAKDILSLPSGSEFSDDETEKGIIEDTTIPETEKNQLIKSRRGQGIFRSRLELIESKCRMTGISNKSHMVASHIKPWSVSDNQERLDGNNGLLLAPHIDHLFDKGFISFKDNGDMIISEKTPEEVLTAWSVELRNVGPFNSKQCEYLKYHREHVLKA